MLHLPDVVVIISHGHVTVKHVRMNFYNGIILAPHRGELALPAFPYAIEIHKVYGRNEVSGTI